MLNFSFKRIIAGMLIASMILTNNSFFALAEGIENSAKQNVEETEYQIVEDETEDQNEEQEEIKEEESLVFAADEENVDELEEDVFELQEIEEEASDEEEETEVETETEIETEEETESVVATTISEDYEEVNIDIATDSEVDEVEELEVLETKGNIFSNTYGEFENKHTDFTPMDQKVFDDTYGNSKYYLTDDIELNEDKLLTATIEICLHGHSFTIGQKAKFNLNGLNMKFKIYDCGEAAEKGQIILEDDIECNRSELPIILESVKISSEALKLNTVGLTIVDCELELSDNSDYIIEANNSLLEYSGNTFDNTKGFLFNNSKIKLTDINVLNSKADTVFTLNNKSELTLDGNCIFEGNKNIFEVDDSKLFILNGSGNAKDVLREDPKEEYLNFNITKKGTTLLDPDYTGMNIVFRRNFGQYIIAVKNSSYVEYDAVIVANEFTGNKDQMGAYVNLDGSECSMVLLNRAYVNQNTKNIVVTENDKIYGSKQYSDGTYDTLNRDATLSFYPMGGEGMTILRDVIKAKDSSYMFQARDFRSDDEWQVLYEGYLYKACMLQGITDDFYLDQIATDLPARACKVYTEVENKGNYEIGSFYLGLASKRSVKFRFNVRDGKFSDNAEVYGDVIRDEKGDIKQVLVDYYPFVGDNEFSDAFNGLSAGVTWIDEWDGYEYIFNGWSTDTQRKVSYKKDGPGTSTGLLEEGVSEIIGKYSEFKYREDIVDLYACYVGNKKFMFNFLARDKYFDENNTYHIESWTNKKEYCRPKVRQYAMPTYTQPEDYKYKGFKVIGFQALWQEHETTDYSIVIKEKPYLSGVYYDHNYEITDIEDGGNLNWYAVFEGDSHNINWYLAGEGIKSVSKLLKLNEEGFYVYKATLSEAYSKLQPRYYVPLAHIDMIQFELEEGLEFLGWTKQVIKKPVTDEELSKIVFVNDYMSFSSTEDCYYYPVLHAESVTAEHDGNVALTQKYIDYTTQFDTGVYELTKDIMMTYPRIINGDVEIDLHGSALTLNDGAYFFGSGNLIFTDCKHSETDPKKRGSIYNQNGDIYKGTGKVSFKQMTFRGKIAHKFTSLQEKVVIDDVEFRDNEFVGILSGWEDDLYPRLMHIDDSTVEIKNTVCNKLSGRIVATNNANLILTNFTMTECGKQPYLITAEEFSNLTLNAPCLFENNKDVVFKIDYSNMIINSNGKVANTQNPDIDSIKNDSVIFRGNKVGSGPLIHVDGADIKFSGIVVDNELSQPIICNPSSNVKTNIHFNGYSYVVNNDGGILGKVGLPMDQQEEYIQQDGDVFDTDSVIEFWTWMWQSYFQCNPFLCRTYKFISNMTTEEAMNLKRDSDGVISNFRLVNNNGGVENGNITYNNQTGIKYMPVLDGIRYNEETGRGYEVAFNFETERDLIDAYIIPKAGEKGIFTYRDLNGDEIEADSQGGITLQYDRTDDTSYQKFINWINNPQIVIKDKYQGQYDFKKFELLDVKGYTEEGADLDGFNFKEARLPYRLRVVLKSLVPATNYKLLFNTNKNIPKNRYGQDFENGSITQAGSKNVIEVNNVSEAVLVDGVFDKKPNAKIPYELDYWAYYQDGKEYKIYPGTYVNFVKDFDETAKSFTLYAQYKMKETKVKFLFNQNIRYEGSKDTLEVPTKVGDTVKLITEDYIDVADNFVYYGWIYKKNYNKQYLNKVELPDYMWIKRFADEERSNNHLLGTSIYINSIEVQELVPLYYFISDSFLYGKQSDATKVTPRTVITGGGSSSGGGGGGGGIAPNVFADNTYTAVSFIELIINAINSIVNPQPSTSNQNQNTAIVANSQQASIVGPSNSNPFAAKIELGQVQTDQQVGNEQFTKAVTLMQAAVATSNTDKANIGNAITAAEANWNVSADGNVHLTTPNGEVKNTWQPVTNANGETGWYKFDVNGAMQTGWVVDDNKVYFLLESGANKGSLVKNVTINIGGYQFSFDKNGALVDLKAGV